MIMSYGKRNFADVINVTNQVTSDREGIQLVLPKSHESLKSQQFSLVGSRSGISRNLKNEIRYIVSGLKMAGAMWQGMRVTVACWKMEKVTEQAPESGL